MKSSSSSSPPSALQTFPVFLILVVIPAACSVSSSIPGCPSLVSLKTGLSDVNATAPLLCFCNPIDEQRSVSIACFRGADLEDLERATQLVHDANLTVQSISLTHLDFGVEVGDRYFADLRVGDRLLALKIVDCVNVQPIELADRVFEGLTALRNLTIAGCGLQHIPSSVANLSDLQHLTLADNRIYHLPAYLLADKKQLSSLNVAGNRLIGLPDGIFESAVNSLTVLRLGDGNKLNETGWREIARLHNLTLLNLDHLDGLTELPASNSTWRNLISLRTLSLEGGSLKSLSANSFLGLDNLRELNLRVNLIDHLEEGAFHGLSTLERLSLAGNYLASIPNRVFTDLPSLHVLDIGWNELSRVDENVLQLPALQSFTLSHNQQLSQVGPQSALGQLRTLNLAETGISTLNASLLSAHPLLEHLDMSRSNLSDIEVDAYSSLSHLRSIRMPGAKLTSLPGQLIGDHLEEIDLSGNPLLCDDQLLEFLFAVEQLTETARNVTIVGKNSTDCDRPYNLRGKPIFSLKPDNLTAYNASLDTTTTVAVPSTTVDSFFDDISTLAPFTFPTLLIGGGNDTIESVVDRGVADNETRYNGDTDLNQKTLSDVDDTMQPTSTAYIVASICAAISLVALAIIVYYIKTQPKVRASATIAMAPQAVHPIEDGFSEIELNSLRAKVATAAI